MTFLVLLIVLWLAVPGMAAHVAGAKGGDATSWFFLSLLFGPFALLAAVGLPDRKLHRLLSDFRAGGLD